MEKKNKKENKVVWPISCRPMYKRAIEQIAQEKDLSASKLAEEGIVLRIKQHLSERKKK